MPKPPTPDPVAAYDAARAHLHALEQELATIDAAITQAGLSGDVTTSVQLLARKPALPTLIDQAQRALAPAELAYYDHLLAEVAREAAPLDQRLADAWAAVEQARAVYNALRSEAGMLSVREQELRERRKHAWRRVQYFEAQPETAPRADPGFVVRSVWQQHAYDRG